MQYLCNLCPRGCGAIRTEMRNTGGYCKVPYKIFAARAALHFGEEPCISGKNGSGTVFFSGCQLSCCYCQNYDVSHRLHGKSLTPKRLSEIFEQLECQGAENINLVSPTPYVPLIIEALNYRKPRIPVVFNSGGYETEATLEILRDYVDVFLLDYKYFSPDRAMKYSSAENYPSVTQKAILKAVDITGESSYNSRGMLEKGTIIRHLLLPLGTNDAISIMNWVKENCPQVLFSLMCQYVPFGDRLPNEINRRVTSREYSKVVNTMDGLGLDGFVQDLSSADISYIPNFNFEGL